MLKAVLFDLDGTLLPMDQDLPRRPQQAVGAADAGVSNPASRVYDSTVRGRCPQGI